MWTITEWISYLRLDAQEVFPVSTPELDLHRGARVVSLEQQRAGVFLQDVPYLKRPLHCQGFYGVQQTTVQGPPNGTEEDRDEAISIAWALVVEYAKETKTTCFVFWQVVPSLKAGHTGQDK